MSDIAFWNTAAGSDQLEGGGEFPELPDKTWFSATNASIENGQSAPTIREFAQKDGSTGYKFNSGLIVDGGENPEANAKFKGKYCFASAFVLPNPEGADAKNIMSGRLTGMLNCFYAAGVAEDEKDRTVRARKRWAVTIEALRKAAEELGLDPTTYASPGLGLAAIAAKDLAVNPRKVLFKSSIRKYKAKDGTDKVGVEVGAYEDFTEAGAARRKVVDFDAALTGSSKPGF